MLLFGASYAEVATLISQNEHSPGYLVELFRKLQLLSTDYLRQRALYAIQELVQQFDVGGSAGGAATAQRTLAAADVSGDYNLCLRLATRTCDFDYDLLLVIATCCYDLRLRFSTTAYFL